ncbi:hypothetical protein [Nevskia sp.]|uniref:hypothetical protein n=1 Tax=Nevskia sp. TaxID=1929292 RepID=UPI0025FD9BBD|nr:hypothetical protein [Nevskia sp.]
MARLTERQWIEARAYWEVDDRVTAADVAKKFGTSKQAVAKQIKSKGWAKKPTLSQIAQRAHVAADAKPLIEKRISEEKAAKDAARAAAEVVGKVVGEVVDSDQVVADNIKRIVDAATKAAEEQAVDARAEVIARHRKEWDDHKLLLTAAIENSNFDKAKLAKITAETTMIRQTGERKAWGLDAYTEAPKEALPQIPDDAYAKVRQRAEAKRIEMGGSPEVEGDDD